jgi:hypothetical protein
MGEYEATGLKVSGVERRNLRTLVIASTLVGVASYIGMKTTWGIVGGLRAWWFS